MSDAVCVCVCVRERYGENESCHHCTFPTANVHVCESESERNEELRGQEIEQGSCDWSKSEFLRQAGRVCDHLKQR